MWLLRILRREVRARLMTTRLRKRYSHVLGLGSCLHCRDLYDHRRLLRVHDLRLLLLKLLQKRRVLEVRWLLALRLETEQAHRVQQLHWLLLAWIQLLPGRLDHVNELAVRLLVRHQLIRPDILNELARTNVCLVIGGDHGGILVHHDGRLHIWKLYQSRAVGLFHVRGGLALAALRQHLR